MEVALSPAMGMGMRELFVDRTGLSIRALRRDVESCWIFCWSVWGWAVVGDVAVFAAY